MPESLGDALLSLRTDDSAFTSGVNRAEGRARQLGTQLDRTSTSSTRLGAEMTRTGRQAEQMGASFARGGQQVTAAAAGQRAGMQQLGFQIGDVATMYSLGARPAQIFASQIGQVTQAIQLASGGTSRLAGFLGGPWGIGLTAATIVLAPFIGKLFETEQAMEAVEFASDGLGDAQTILARVFDMTTGRINTQSTALINLARAQVIAGQYNARIRQTELREQLGDAANERQPVGGQIGGRGGLRQLLRTPAASVVQGVSDGSIDPSAGIAQLEGLVAAGQLTEGEFVSLAAAIANLGAEIENEGFYAQARQDIDTGQLSGAFLSPGSSRNRSGRATGSPSARAAAGPDQAEIEARFDRQLQGVGQQILRARLQLATSAEERAEISRRIVEWERIQSIEDVRADEELNAAQKTELEEAIVRLADTETEAINLGARIALEEDARALAEADYDARREALQLQFDLAETEAARKALALDMLAAEDAYLRSRLQSVIISEAANDAERARAQVALDAMKASAAQRRESVARANETSVERYMRDLNRSPAQINEAIDAISIEGLEQLNDGLVDAITGARSLGEVFSRVADQIIADLLRIVIQQAIIQPLASQLFGGGGGGGGLGALFGGGKGGGGGLPALFAGLFADGGTIPRGQFGIVGEAGPEPVFATSRGVGVLPNSALRSMGGAGGRGISVSIPITIDATGADAAALERVRAEIAGLRQELPGRIISTVQDADNRRIISLRGGR